MRPEETLTPREKEVVQMVAEGESNRHIAGVLAISEETVKRHMSNIFDKLGYDTRTQLAIWANGLADRARIAELEKQVEVLQERKEYWKSRCSLADSFI